MATRGISMTIQYVAWDGPNSVGKTADAANHTLRWIKDGVVAAPTNSPVEIDSVNCPGIYSLTLTASETDCNIGTLGGVSSSPGVSIIPVTIQFERLPDAAPGITGGLPLIGSVPLTRLDVDVSSRATNSGVWSIVIDNSLTAKQVLAIIGSALAGILSGAGTTTVTIKAIDDNNTTRIQATVDNVGNRSSITLTPP